MVISLSKKKFDPKDKKGKPRGLRKEKLGKRWEHVATVGEFVGLPTLAESDIVTKKEKASGKVKVERLGDKEDGLRSRER